MWTLGAAAFSVSALPSPPDLLNPMSDLMVAGSPSTGEVMVWTSDFTERYNPTIAQYNSSFSASDQHCPAAGAGTAVVGEKAYLIGGGDGGTPYGTVGVWDMAAGSSSSFTLLTPLSVPRSELAASAIGSVLYAVGGFGGSWNELECADSAASPLKWATGSTLPTARYGLAAEAVGGVLYTFGGNAWHDSNSRHVEAFAPLAAATAAAAVAAPRVCACQGAGDYCNFKGSAYPWTGTCHGAPFGACSCLDCGASDPTKCVAPPPGPTPPGPSPTPPGPTPTPPGPSPPSGACGGTWSTKAPIPIGVSFPATTVVGTDIYLIGGDLTSGTTSSLQTGLVQIYSTTTNTWRNGTTVLKPPRSHLSAVYVLDTVFAFGGTTGTGNFQRDMAKAEIIALT